MACPYPITRAHPRFESGYHLVPCGVCSYCKAMKVRRYTGALIMHSRFDARTCGDALPQFTTLTYAPANRPEVVSEPKALGADWKPHPNARQEVHELYAKSPEKAHYDYLLKHGWTKQDIWRYEHGKFGRVPSAKYAHIQDFMKRIRIRIKRAGLSNTVTCSWCPEYTPKNKYPHYHGMVWNCPPDIWISEIASWERRFGFAKPCSNWLSIDPYLSTFTPGRAGYIGGHAKDVHRSKWDPWLRGREPERIRSSSARALGTEFCWLAGERTRQTQFLPAWERSGLGPALLSFLQAELSHTFRVGKYFYPYTKTLKEAYWLTVLQDVQPNVLENVTDFIADTRCEEFDLVSFGGLNEDGEECADVEARKRDKTIAERIRAGVNAETLIRKRAAWCPEPRFRSDSGSGCDGVASSPSEFSSSDVWRDDCESAAQSLSVGG